MQFEENNKAIYIQIADRICDDIVKGVFQADSRLPSVREYAASVEVNANTVMRSYERLTNKGLIYNKRGIGFFVAPEARLKIISERGNDLIDKQLDSLFGLMSQMGITPEKLAESYRQFIERQTKTQSQKV